MADSQQTKLAEGFGADVDTVFDSAFESDFGSAFCSHHDSMFESPFVCASVFGCSVCACSIGHVRCVINTRPNWVDDDDLISLLKFVIYHLHKYFGR